MRSFSFLSGDMDNLWIHADRMVMTKMLYDREYDISGLDPNNEGFLISCVRILFGERALITEHIVSVNAALSTKLGVDVEYFETLLKIKPLDPVWDSMNENQKYASISDILYIECENTEKEYVSFIEGEEIIIGASSFSGPIFILLDQLMDFSIIFLKENKKP